MVTPKTKAAIEEAAWKSIPNKPSQSSVDHAFNSNYRQHYKKGMEEVINHPERYGLTSLRLDETWPLKDILTKLVDASDALLTKYDYDHTYWEQIETANKEAKKILEELK